VAATWVLAGSEGEGQTRKTPWSVPQRADASTALQSSQSSVYSTRVVFSDPGKPRAVVFVCCLSTLGRSEFRRRVLRATSQFGDGRLAAEVCKEPVPQSQSRPELWSPKVLRRMQFRSHRQATRRQSVPASLTGTRASLLLACPRGRSDEVRSEGPSR
jgi:hypothetical protein